MRARVWLVCAAGLAAGGACVADRADAAGLGWLGEQRSSVVGGSVDGLYGTTGVALAPDGANAYVVSGWDDSLVTFARDAGSGALTQIDREVDWSSGGAAKGLDLATDVAVSLDGTSVYVASPWGHAVSTFRRGVDGSLDWLEIDRDDSVGGSSTGLAGASAVEVSPDGENVYVAAPGDSAVGVFRRTGAGRLRWVTAEACECADVGVGDDEEEATSGAADIAISPDGRSLYVAEPRADSISSYRRLASGRLRWLERDADSSAGGDAQGLSRVAWLEVAPGGGTVYASGREPVLTALRRDPRSSRLRWIQSARGPSAYAPTGLAGSRRLAVSPDGASVYMTASLDDTVAEFAVDPLSGKLGWVSPEASPPPREPATKVDGAYGVAVAPDGATVYATSRLGHSIVWFEPLGLAPSTEPSISIADVSIPENAPTARLAVHLDRPGPTAVQVDFATSAGTASAPDDYAQTAGTATIPAKRAIAWVEIPLEDDQSEEAEEAISVDLSNPAGATIADGHGVATIADDDAPPPSGPNILLIVTDDQPAGEQYMDVIPRTMEVFGDGGTSFSNMHVTTPLCCPSRASIFSGRYVHNHGIAKNDGRGFDARLTWQRLLHESGYRTGLVGKYLNQVHHSVRPYFDHRYGPWGSDPDEGELAAASAAEFFEQAENEDERPWALWVSSSSPHSPFTARPANPEPLSPWVVPAAFEEADVSDKHPIVDESGRSFQDPRLTGIPDGIRTELQAADEMVGSIFTDLDRLGERARTLAMFISDNGFLLGQHRISAKAWPYLEATQVPFYLTWPGHVEEGALRADLVANIDLAPTILDAAGVQADYPLDGRSILSGVERPWLLLESSSPAAIPGWSAYLSPARHYVEWGDGSVEDYDLTSDRDELNAENAHDPTIAGLLEQARSCAGEACP